VEAEIYCLHHKSSKVITIEYILVEWNLSNPIHQDTREMCRIAQDVGILRFYWPPVNSRHDIRGDTVVLFSVRCRSCRRFTTAGSAVSVEAYKCPDNIFFPANRHEIIII
jgi:hypothetical protein